MEPCVPSVELDDHLSPPPPDNLSIPCMSDFHDARDCETFGFTVGHTESMRSDPPLASSCRTSPSPYDDVSSQGEFTEYHLLINGMP